MGKIDGAGASLRQCLAIPDSGCFYGKRRAGLWCRLACGRDSGMAEPPRGGTRAPIQQISEVSDPGQSDPPARVLPAGLRAAGPGTVCGRRGQITNFQQNRGRHPCKS
ncbi:hypothetical protein IBTHAUMO2_320043 [Nitrosopumilaceae archaeon]|nr:hypothetical protein IBTHAUMO2_320043 [Nitrosopumilaceae archaeon]